MESYVLSITSLVSLGLGSLSLGIMLGVGFQKKRSAEEAALLVTIWEKINFVCSEASESRRKFEEVYYHLSSLAQDAEENHTRISTIEQDIESLPSNSEDEVITQVLPKIELD